MVQLKNESSVEFPIVKERPPFTLEDLRRAIPRHCLDRSLARSLFYLLRDFGCIVLSSFAVAQFESPLILPVFWLVQGLFFWALFVSGHDAGHGSFSSSDSINYIVGHIAHAPILVPFHSWRISHRKHHQNTGNADKDETFVPPTASEYAQMSTIEKLIRFDFYWAGGWIIYLTRGMPRTYYSHFNPNAEIFAPHERKLVTQSVASVFLMVAVLIAVGMKYGAGFVGKYYFGPYLVFCGWVSIVTHSHHTHPDLPWFRHQEWDFMRGALSTVDRNYGFLIEDIHHNIGTHVVHHLFSKIPHYHLKEATEAIKPVLGKYYRKSSWNMFSTILMMRKFCRFIPDIGDVIFYRSGSTKAE